MSGNSKTKIVRLYPPTGSGEPLPRIARAMQREKVPADDQRVIFICGQISAGACAPIQQQRLRAIRGLERKRAQFSAKLAPFFNELQGRTYLAGARLHREVVRAVLKAGLQFGGFFDGAGRAHVLGEANAAGALWALAADGRGVTRCDAHAGDAMEKWAGFSPIFFVPVDRQAILDAAARKIGGKPLPPEIPFFAAP